MRSLKKSQNEPSIFMFQMPNVNLEFQTPFFNKVVSFILILLISNFSKSISSGEIFGCLPRGILAYSIIKCSNLII